MNQKLKTHAVLVRKPEGKIYGGPRSRGNENIKIYLKEIRLEGMDCIFLANDRGQWQALVNTVMNLAQKLLGSEDGLFCEVTYMLIGSGRIGILEIKCGITTVNGHAIAQAVTDFPSWWPGFDPRLGHVVDKVALGQVFSDHLSFPCQFLLHHLLHIHSSSCH
jgi:hypothetical protein